MLKINPSIYLLHTYFLSNDKVEHSQALTCWGYMDKKANSCLKGAHSLVKRLQYNLCANRHEYKASQDKKEHEVWGFRDSCAQNAPSH